MNTSTHHSRRGPAEALSQQMGVAVNFFFFFPLHISLIECVYTRASFGVPRRPNASSSWLSLSAVACKGSEARWRREKRGKELQREMDVKHVCVCLGEDKSGPLFSYYIIATIIQFIY